MNLMRLSVRLRVMIMVMLTVVPVKSAFWMLFFQESFPLNQAYFFFTSFSIEFLSASSYFTSRF